LKAGWSDPVEQSWDEGTDNERLLNSDEGSDAEKLLNPMSKSMFKCAMMVSCLGEQLDERVISHKQQALTQLVKNLIVVRCDRMRIT
jgi:hypothetical protein